MVWEAPTELLTDRERTSHIWPHFDLSRGAKAGCAPAQGFAARGLREAGGSIAAT